MQIITNLLLGVTLAIGTCIGNSGSGGTLTGGTESTCRRQIAFVYYPGFERTFINIGSTTKFTGEFNFISKIISV